MSANYGAENPGMKLIRACGKPEKVTNHSYSGKTGKTLIEAYPTSIDLKNFSLILGLDLFFWDSIETSFFSSRCQQGVKSIEEFIRRAEEVKVPLVLGSLPNIPRTKILRSCRDTINATLRLKCTLKRGCIIFDLERIYQDVKIKGATYKKRYYRMRDLLLDEIHPNQIGSAYLAILLGRDLMNSF